MTRCPTCTTPVSTPGKCAECIDGPCHKCGRYVETNEFGFCVRCLTPLYRWVPACSTCHREVASSYDLDGGECVRCVAERRAA